MAKRIVNKAERNAERYDAKETGYRLFEDSQNGKTFDRLMPLIVSEQNIILAYRNICKNSGSKTPSTDGKTIVAIQSLPIESVIKTVRNKLNYYQPKKVRGMNIPINDADHPLILKVASMQSSRIQVYFIDNDDYFLKADDDIDPVGSNRTDNDERSIFFARGTMETVRKLRWEPDVVHCTGWITALSPMYLRHLYADDPSFAGARIVYTVAPGEMTAGVDPDLFNKLKDDGFTDKELKQFKNLPLDTKLLHRMAISSSDAVIFLTDEPDLDLLEFARKRKLPVLLREQIDENFEAYDEFYKKLTGK